MPSDNSSEKPQNAYFIGLLLAVGGTALFALKSIFIKLAFAEGVDTATLLMLRMVISLPFYLFMLYWLFYRSTDKAVTLVRKDVAGILLLGFIGYYLSSLLDIEGLRYISAQLERLTLYSYPIITTLLGWFFLKEVITKRVMAALVLTYSGVLLLYWHESLTANTNTGLGVVLVLGAALSFSCYIVFSKPFIMRLGSRLFTSLAMIASVIYAVIHFSVTHQLSDLDLSYKVWLLAFLLAFFSTVIPSFMVSEAIARIGSSKTSIIGTAGPIVTIALAVMFLDEPFGWFHAFGMLLVIIGVGLLGKKS